MKNPWKLVTVFTFLTVAGTVGQTVMLDQTPAESYEECMEMGEQINDQRLKYVQQTGQNLQEFAIHFDCVQEQIA